MIHQVLWPPFGVSPRSSLRVAGLRPSCAHLAEPGAVPWAEAMAIESIEIASGKLTYLWKMVIEIVDFPIDSMVIYDRYVNVYQRVAIEAMATFRKTIGKA